MGSKIELGWEKLIVSKYDCYIELVIPEVTSSLWIFIVDQHGSGSSPLLPVP